MKTRKETLLSQTLSIFALVMIALTLTALSLVPQTAHAQGVAYHSFSNFGMAALAEQELRHNEEALASTRNKEAQVSAAVQVDRTTVQPQENDAVRNIHENVQERK